MAKKRDAFELILLPAVLLLLGAAIGYGAAFAMRPLSTEVGNTAKTNEPESEQIAHLRAMYSQLAQREESYKKQIATLKAQVGMKRESSQAVSSAPWFPKASPTIVRAAAVNDIAWTNNPHILIRVGAVVRNDTNKAIGELDFHVQLRDEQRTIPHGEVIESVEIRGGLEPGEQKTIEITVVGSDLNLPRILGLQSLPDNTKLFVAIVTEKDIVGSGELHEKLADVLHVEAPYKFVKRSDPNMDALLKLTP